MQAVSRGTSSSSLNHALGVEMFHVERLFIRSPLATAPASRTWRSLPRSAAASAFHVEHYGRCQLAAGIFLKRLEPLSLGRLG